MPIGSSAQLHLSTKDPREAVGKTIELIRGHATALDELEIDFGLHVTSRGSIAIG